MLGAALLDRQIGRNVAGYDLLYYYAEAGIELALAVLPRDYEEFLAFEGVFENLDKPPYFKVEVTNTGENNTKLLYSTGYLEGKKRALKVLARFSPLGANGLYSKEYILLDCVDVRGNVTGGEVSFCSGASRIWGNLYCKDVRAFDGGIIDVYGRRCELAEVPVFAPDFNALYEKAQNGDGWYMPEVTDNDFIWGELFAEDARKVFVPGNLLIEGEFFFNGLIVVRGEVIFRCPSADNMLVLLAEGNIFLEMEQEPVSAIMGSNIFYSSEMICDCRSGAIQRLKVEGALLAKDGLELSGLDLIFNEEGLYEYLEEIGPESFVGLASFNLEWVDSVPRR